MPAYYNRDNYGDDGGGGQRYRGRGRGRGGYGRGGREGRGSGSRGYNRGGGGGRHSDDRYKWSERRGSGGRQRGSGGYRDNGYGHSSRYRDGSGSSHQGGHMWHSGSDRGEGGSHMFRSSGNHFSSKESRIALNILNAELALEHESMDWDGVRSPPVHKYPQRERLFDPRKAKRTKGQSGYSRGPVEWLKLDHFMKRKMEMARLEMPRPEKRESKDTEEKTPAAEGKKEAKEGEPESATAKGGSDAPPPDATQSDSATADGPKDSETDAKRKDDSKKKDESHDETNVVIPRAALKCHMCAMPKFPSTKSYLKHIEGKQHAILADCFHDRNIAVMDLLMAESKLACKWRPRKGGSKLCRKCECFMITNIQQHCQTTEHTLVSQFASVQCCSYKYNRANLEEHRLSLRHLKNQWDIDQKNTEMQEQEEEEEKRKEMDKAFHEDVHRLKMSEEGEEELTSATLPPHDPTKPIGLKFLYRETQYRCEICRTHLRNAPHAEYHFRSVDHYTNLCSHLAEEKEKKELERYRKRLEISPHQEQESKTKENAAGDDDDNFEDMNNMETVDEALEDVDMEIHLGDETGGTGKEEKEDDVENGGGEGGDLDVSEQSMGSPLVAEIGEDLDDLPEELLHKETPQEQGKEEQHPDEEEQDGCKEHDKEQDAQEHAEEQDAQEHGEEQDAQEHVEEQDAKEHDEEQDAKEHDEEQNAKEHDKERDEDPGGERVEEHDEPKPEEEGEAVEEKC